MTEVRCQKSESRSLKAAKHTAKRLARLAAVQALYQGSFGQETLPEIIRGVVDGKFAGLRDEDGKAMPLPPDKELFGAIVEGVAAHAPDLDALISGAMDNKKSSARLEVLLRVILQAGAFELFHHADVPAGVIISDYVDVARAFYNAKEPGLVNGVLDKIAGKARG
jgi:transcription antitermination protein NusB